MLYSLQLFSPGCGYNDCLHCDNHRQPLPLLPKVSAKQTSPPPLPPKPSWLRTRTLRRPRSRPASINESVSSDATEQSSNAVAMVIKQDGNMMLLLLRLSLPNAASRCVSICCLQSTPSTRIRSKCNKSSSRTVTDNGAGIATRTADARGKQIGITWSRHWISC